MAFCDQSRAEVPHCQQEGRLQTPLRQTDRVPDRVEPKAILTIFGVSSLTANFGMTDVGKPAEGSADFVSVAAGSDGSFAGQIARSLGARVIGTPRPAKVLLGGG